MFADQLIISIPQVQPNSTDWEVIFNGLLTDFSVGSANELQLSYDITTNRAYEAFVFQKDCITAIEDAIVTLSSDTGVSPKDETHDALVLTYDVDKANIAGSSIWNSDNQMMELCVIVQLVLEDPHMVLQEDERVLAIDFDLSADFNATADLEEGIKEQSLGNATTDGYVNACKCGGPQSFTCESSPLLPNDLLHTCVWSTDLAVKIASLDSMVRTIVFCRQDTDSQ